MAAALSETAAAMGGLRVSASAEDAAAVHASFEHLQQVTVAHLDHEEAETRAGPAGEEGQPRDQGDGQRVPEGPADPRRPDTRLAHRRHRRRDRDALGAEIPTPVLLMMTRVFGRGYRREIAPVWRA